MPIAHADGAPAALDIIIARGHQNIRASNSKTLEITKDPYVTPRGDCIAACCADKAGPELGRALRLSLATPGVVEVVIEAGLARDVIRGRTPGVIPSDLNRLVIRRSRYVDGSTLAIDADKAAADLSRALVAELRKGIIARIVISVWTLEAF